VKRWLLLALAALPTPALADWQYTHWGMSVDEVIAASNGSAQEIKDRKGDRVRKMPRLIVGTTKEGETAFAVEFYFEDKKLRLIRYAPTGTMDCAAEEAFLLDRFGPAEPIEKIIEFRDKNLVLLRSRDRVWALPGGDQMNFNSVRIERPDLPNIQVTPMCVVLIESASPAATKA
jgi:hypothetical protein